jgi:hypothetical protein
VRARSPAGTPRPTGTPPGLKTGYTPTRTWADMRAGTIKDNITLPKRETHSPAPGLDTPG